MDNMPTFCPPTTATKRSLASEPVTAGATGYPELARRRTVACPGDRLSARGTVCLATPSHACGGYYSAALRCLALRAAPFENPLAELAPPFWRFEWGRCWAYCRRLISVSSNAVMWRWVARWQPARLLLR